MRRLLAFTALAVMPLLFAGACRYMAKLPQEPGLHPRLTPFTYLEKGKLIAFAVDVEAARQREGSDLVPFGIGVADLGIKRLVLTRESFTLVDDAGRRYAMASLQEMRAAAVAPDFDSRVTRNFFSVWAARFKPWPRVPTSFFPLARLHGNPLVRDRFELYRRSWMYDLVYFPHPEGKLLGRKYEMWIDSEQLPEPTLVKFTIK